MGISELEALLRSPKRKIVISEDSIDLDDMNKPNTIYILMISDAWGAAGGRAGGFGQRTIEAAVCFKIKDGQCEKVIEVSNADILSSMDLPIGIARIPASLTQGVEEMLYGVIDPDVVREYNKHILG